MRWAGFSVAWSTGEDGWIRVEDDEHVPVTVRVTPGTPVTVRVRRGLAVEGVVSRPDGAPIEGALVLGMGTVSSGTFETVQRAEARSGGDGGFRLVAAPKQRLELTARHPRFLPAMTSLPQGPDGTPVRLALTPALVARFRIHAGANGPPPTFATVTWRTKGPNPRQQTVTLGDPAVADSYGLDLEDPPPDPSVSRAVKIPATGSTVDLTVASLGYRPFLLVDEPLPPAGDERIYDVPLERDPSVGRLRLLLVDDAGQTLPYATSGALARVRRADGGPKPNQRPTDLDGQALFEGLAPAAYQVVVAYPGRAPGFASCDVAAGGDLEVRVALGAEARLTVKFPGLKGAGARFRLLRDGEVVVAFPTAPSNDGPPKDPRTPSFTAGPDGITLGGLGAGHYEVEVVSPDLVAPMTPVDLGPAESRELSITATRRSTR